MKTLSILFFVFLIHTNSSAQNQTAISGQPNQIKFNIPNVINTNKCNIEVTLPNQQKLGVEVEGPQFIAGFEFTPQQTGSTTITWEGKTKVRGLASVFACPGSGIIQVQVNGNTDQVAQQWNQYFTRVPEEIRDCVKVGMDLSQLKYQSFADPNAVLTSPDDAKLKPIYEKCDNFAKQNQPRKAVPCTLPSQNNLKTICDGVYAERQPDGRLKTISRANAVQLHFEGKPWTVGVLENTDARTTRLKQEDEDKSKQAANIAAQKEAEEKDRKFKESPEYKKQQADLERKRIADEKEAAKKQAEMERIRVAEEKQAAALKAKEEQERELRAQKEKAALEAQKTQEEKSRQQRQNSNTGELKNKNFLIGLCTVNTEKWAKYNCNSNLVMNSDEMTVSFQTFEDSNIVLDLVFGSKCDQLLGASKCINKTYRGGATYEIISNGIIIQNTHAGGCVVPNKYMMEKDILYQDYAGEARGNCKDEQIAAARRMKELGKRRIYYVNKN